MFFLLISSFLCALAVSPALARPLQNSDLPVELQDQNIATTLHVKTGIGWTQEGVASYYRQSRIFRRTASGERFNQNAMTAAHRTLPLGTKVRVTNLANGRSVVVRINDRPAQTNPRVIDLAQGAAQRLGMMGSGTADVELSLAADNSPVEVADAPDYLDPPIKSRTTIRHVSHHAVAHHRTR